MKTSTKVIIDKYAGRSIVAILHFLFRILHFRKKENSNSLKTIVVCKFLGMGSIVQSTPLIQSFKNQFPEARIIYLTSIANKKFIEQISIIDESIVINDSSFFSTIISTISCIRILLSKKIDLFIDLELYSNFSKIFTIVSKANLKFGMSLDSTKQKNYSSTFILHPDKPVSESYLEMCKQFDSHVVTHGLYSFLIDHEKRNSILRRFEISQEYIIVNPNASDLRIERRWPKENFSELITKISSENSSVKIVLIGSPTESNYVNEIFTSIETNHKRSIVNTAGKLSIDELILLISGTKLMITNDTGPMHLAFALNRPTVAIFGPASPSQFGNHLNSTAVYKKVACSPCVHDHINPPCQGNNICMKGIDVSSVYRYVVPMGLVE